MNDELKENYAWRGEKKKRRKINKGENEGKLCLKKEKNEKKQNVAW